MLRFFSFHSEFINGHLQTFSFLQYNYSSRIDNNIEENWSELGIVPLPAETPDERLNHCATVVLSTFS